MANGNDKYPFAESIILTCLTLVLLAFTTSSILFLAYFFLDLPLGSDPPAIMLATSVCFGLLTSYALLMRLSAPFFSQTFIPQLKLSLFWLFTSVACGVVYAFLAIWVGHYFTPPSGIESTLEQITNGGFLSNSLLFFSVIVLAPLGEEYLFRGVLLSGLSSKFSTFSAISLSSVVFMSFHLLEYYGYWFALVAILILGVLLAIIRLRSRSMLAPIVCHASYNLIMLTLA
ncbi:CPBP family intramembrane glutamic endopeptidase [Kangiella aquimarina]|uniref:Type II CAAX endopeptidase family protein n=1 Tax=Kangiella aquimarina TaxID=261965 RepID=A0ABZ0X529_9GAMM|nr:type II CAAX endopeptidase family protein [Kangiella aquimarina]WQG85639.1 type II CAAX endopeptidase family protein [Kangiella aquimarina]